MADKHAEYEVPRHLRGECDVCENDLDEHGSNLTIISNSSGDDVTVRCDGCEEREQEHWREYTDG